jgi:hypothetical protein
VQIQPDWGAVEFFGSGDWLAEAGANNFKQNKGFWIPAFAGMSGNKCWKWGGVWLGT